MTAILWQDVVDHAAELANPKVAIGAQATLLDWANNLFNLRVWGGEESSALKLARIYAVAHVATLIKIGGGGSKAGPVTSESEGGLSRSYALITAITSGAGDPNWSATAYGRAYLTLLSGRAGARLPFVAGWRSGGVM